MEPLLTSFVAAGLAEWGDKSQWLVVLLAARFARPMPILAGVAVAALANALIAAAAGIFVHDMIVARAASLLVAVALLFAGVAGLIRHKGPGIAERWPIGPFLTAAGGFFLLGLGDRTQFVTFALAAHYDSLALTAAGAAAGMIAASLPAALLGERLPALAHIGALRIGIAVLFLLAGFFVAITSLQLV